MLNHAQVIGVEDEGSPVFRDFKQLAGTRFFHQMITPSAGLSALSAVGVPVRQIVGEQTAPRKRDAHGAVHKGFQTQFRRRVGANGADLFQRDLSCKNNGICSLLIKDVCSSAVDHAKLCADMSGNMRGIPFGKGKHTNVGYDERIRSGTFQKGEIGRQIRQLALPRERVAGDVDLNAVLVCESDASSQLLVAEAGAGGTHAVSAACKIDGVRPIVHSHDQFLIVPRWGEQFKTCAGGCWRNN